MGLPACLAPSSFKLCFRRIDFGGGEEKKTIEANQSCGDYANVVVVATCTLQKGKYSFSCCVLHTLLIDRQMFYNAILGDYNVAS